MVPGKKGKLEGRREQRDQPSRSSSVDVVRGQVLAEPRESVMNVVRENKATSHVQIVGNANSACFSFNRSWRRSS